MKLDTKTYGHFDDNRKEYVITNPRTPYPWINYLGNSEFFSLISNTSGGYSFYKDARLRRISRYRYNNVPTDDGGKYFYIKEGDKIWNPGWKPAKTELDSYECRHGLGYTQITGTVDKLECSQLAFVPLQFNGEVQMLTLTNNSSKQKDIKLFSFVEWALWNALDDMTNFQRNFSTGEVEVEGSVIYHKTEYKERRNHYAFYSVNIPVDGFETQRDAFVGLYDGFENPRAVAEGQLKNGIAHGWSPIASHQVNLSLAPGETKKLIFVLGYAENEPGNKFNTNGSLNKENAYEMLQKFEQPNQVMAALNDLKKFWQNHLEVFQLESGDDKLNRLVNTWNPYQCKVTFNFSRSASYFESGIGRGMGFRDSNQDLIGYIHMDAAASRARILDIAATQLPDGSAYHQYQPLTKRGNTDIGGEFNDDPLWLILSVSAYIKETGDWTILEENVPYNNDLNNSASLFEHLKKSFYHVVYNLGQHDLPLIGRADWNDCLNLNCFSDNPDESFQTTKNKEGGVAESVMIAGMFVLYGKEFAQICKHLNKPDEQEKALQNIAEMEQAIEQHGWDGDWFLRAYDNFSNKVGSNDNEEGKIFIESQGFCIMAGVGLEDGKAEKTQESVNEHLATPYGLVLHSPAFSKYYIEYGEISTYPAGYKENGGIFCHNNPWIIIAETMVGNGGRAFDYYSRIAP